METSGEMRGTNNRIGIVMAKLYEAESLSDVFSGCCGVFHTSAFIDPAGISGYSVSLVSFSLLVLPITSAFPKYFWRCSCYTVHTHNLESV